MAKTWTEENEDFIRERFRHKTYAELADHFGVSQKAMESKIRRMGLKKQDYKESDPMPAVLPPQTIEEHAAPVETGPTPIKSASLLPRRPVQPTETPGEREARLEAECDAAEEENTRRAEMRGRGTVVKALKKFEVGVKRLSGEWKIPQRVVEVKHRHRSSRGCAFGGARWRGPMGRANVLARCGPPRVEEWQPARID